MFILSYLVIKWNIPHSHKDLVYIAHSAKYLFFIGDLFSLTLLSASREIYYYIIFTTLPHYPLISSSNFGDKSTGLRELIQLDF